MHAPRPRGPLRACRPRTLLVLLVLQLRLLCVPHAATAAAAAAAASTNPPLPPRPRRPPVSPTAATSSKTATTTVLITGSTGVLGRALVGRAVASTSPPAPRRVFTTQRRVHAAAAAAANDDDDNNSNSFFLDLADRTDVSTFFTRHRAVSSSPLVLVNNAGVCVAGHSADAFKVSLDVNCWAPALLAEGAAAATHGDNPADVTVVNVSSGDGELVFLHSDVAHRVHALDSVAVSEE